MIAIPLGTKAYRRQASFEPEVELVNMLIERDQSASTVDPVARVMRPGSATIETDGTGATRGIFRQTGLLGGDRFKVVGSSLYRETTFVGSVGGPDLIAWATSIERLFMLSGETIYHYDGVTLGTVPLPDDAAGVAVDIDTLNSYVFVSCSDGTIYWIVPGETEIDPVNFVTAESAPDGLLAGRRLESEIFFFGGSSVEPWQLTGDQDAPIQKAIGRQYERGCLHRDTVRRFDNSIHWVDENGNVCRAGAQPEIVADEGISERIRKRTADLSAMTFSWDRHALYVLRIPGQGSFLFDASTKEWGRFTSAASDMWAPHVAVSDEEGTFFGSAASSAVIQISSESGFDDDAPIEWRITGNVAVVGRPKRNDSFSVGVGCADDCTVRLRWRDADQPFPEYYEELQARAPADQPTMYRMGSISPPYRSFELSGVDGVRVRISNADTEAWQ